MQITGIGLNVLDVILSLSNVNKKRYCTVTIPVMQRLMSEWHGCDRSSRTVRRHISSLVQEGLITRRRRTKHLDNGKIINLANLYTFTRPFYKWLNSLIKRGQRLLKATERTFLSPKYYLYRDSYSKPSSADSKNDERPPPNTPPWIRSGLLKPGQLLDEISRRKKEGISTLEILPEIGIV